LLLRWKQGSRVATNVWSAAISPSLENALTAGARNKTHFQLPALLNLGPEHPYAIQADVLWMVRTMVSNVRELRPKPPETEKITINLGYVDLGHVDLMVQEGFYSNRTDFIRTAIRNQLERHADVVKQSTARKSLDLGLRNYSREDLEAAQRACEMLHINVLGLASISQDVTPELARATIASVSVLGALHASPAVKAALADRTR
jgi:Arc/MetJ-type ribon-helix-helix transcriptional regulator